MSSPEAPSPSTCSLTWQNAGVDLLNSVPLEEADMSKFRQVLEVNVMSAVLVRAQNSNPLT